MEASPTPGRAARAGAPEIQPASWEGERGHRHVCVCGCAHVCQRMGGCVQERVRTCGQARLCAGCLYVHTNSCM